MDDDKKVEVMAVLLETLMTKTFMLGRPQDWGNANDTRIEIAIPMPKAVIDRLKELKASIDKLNLGPDTDFNEILSMYVTELIYYGLSRKVRDLPDSQEELKSGITDFLTSLAKKQ